MKRIIVLLISAIGLNAGIIGEIGYGYNYNLFESGDQLGVKEDGTIQNIFGKIGYLGDTYGIEANYYQELPNTMTSDQANDISVIDHSATGMISYMPGDYIYRSKRNAWNADLKFGARLNMFDIESIDGLAYIGVGYRSFTQERDRSGTQNQSKSTTTYSNININTGEPVTTTNQITKQTTTTTTTTTTRDVTTTNTTNTSSVNVNRSGDNKYYYIPVGFWVEQRWTGNLYGRGGIELDYFLYSDVRGSSSYRYSGSSTTTTQTDTGESIVETTTVVTDSSGNEVSRNTEQTGYTAPTPGKPSETTKATTGSPSENSRKKLWNKFGVKAFYGLEYKFLAAAKVFLQVSVAI